MRNLAHGAVGELDAEVALGYETVEDPSVFLRFPIVEAGDPALEGASMVVWTTTPWTLPSNTGVAIDPSATYVEVSIDGERLIVGEALREAAFGDRGEPVGTMPGCGRPLPD